MRDGAELIDISGELFEPGCIIIATIVIAAICLAMWYFTVNNPGSKDAPAQDWESSTTAAAEPSRRRRDDLSWLAALVVTSLLILAFQLAAGFGTGALTLIADSAHTAADTVSYALSWFIERAKCKIGTVQSERAQRTAAHFDALSAAFSVTLVLGTSVCATADAIRRLCYANGETGKLAPKQEDLGLIGPALLGFAVLSTAANCGLLAMHSRRKRAAAERSATALSIDSTPEPPLAEEWEFGDCDEDFACMPCLPPSLPPLADNADETPPATQKAIGSTSRYGKQLAWLHNAFHPSCSGDDCSANAVDVPGTSDTTSSKEARPIHDKTDGDDEQSNLNLYGAVLHLITDVLRSLVILAVALLVQLGIIRDAPTADAFCAIAVSVCILLGSLALLKAAAVSLREALRPVGQDLGADPSTQVV